MLVAGTKSGSHATLPSLEWIRTTGSCARRAFAQKAIAALGPRKRARLRGVTLRRGQSSGQDGTFSRAQSEGTACEDEQVSPRTPAVGPASLAAWCADHLGSAPTAELFRSGYLSAVVGLRLADGREVVVKIRPTSPRI